MLPCLEAEESMREAERLGVGTGAYKTGTINSITARWRSEAKIAAAARKPARLPPGLLGEMGIGYQVVGASGG